MTPQHPSEDKTPVSQQAEDLKPVTQEGASRHEDAEWTDLQALSLLSQLTQAPPKTPQEGWNAAMKVGEIALQRAHKELTALRDEVKRLKRDVEGTRNASTILMNHIDSLKEENKELNTLVLQLRETPTRKVFPIVEHARIKEQLTASCQREQRLRSALQAVVDMGYDDDPKVWLKVQDALSESKEVSNG